jgi:Abnormal spindle-like microcephaly-assoc'd, ASPM-SPD-2-Hydin
VSGAAGFVFQAFSFALFFNPNTNPNMRKLLLSAILGGCSIFAFAQNGKVVSLKTEVVNGTLIKVTSPLRNFEANPGWKDIPVRDINGRIGPKHNDVSPEMHPNPGFTSDPALQKSYNNTVGGIQKDAAIGVNFEGIGNQPVNPPDPTMAVGPNHVIQMINGNSGAKFKIFNKAGVAAGPDIFLDALTGLGGLGDPIVLYDQLADRFVMTEFANDAETPTEGLIIAVSQTPDPTGAWYIYFFGTGTTFPDYPKFSVWPDAYYATTNDFAGGTTYDGSSVYAFDRTLMLAGNPAATMQKIKFSTTVFTRFFTMCPVLLQGTTVPPAGTGGLFAYMWDDAFSDATTDVDSVGVMELDVDFATPANTVFSIQASLVAAAFKSDICTATRGRCISQPGTTVALEALQQRVMNQPIYRKFAGYEGIVFTHVVDKGGNISAPRWYELQKTTGNWGIHQQQTYSPDNTHRFMPSIAYDAAGNIALGYNVSSAATGVFPGARITGHRLCDPLNKMGQIETTIIAGSASNTSTRYGDYNHLVCDPNGSTFWITVEYNPAALWSTRVASFTLDACTSVSNIDANGYTVTAGNCGGTSVLDPGEVITVDFSIINNGIANSAPLTATLLTTGGVSLPSAPQNYGVLNVGGPAVSRPFTFKLNGTCGGTVTATLQVTDGVSTTSFDYVFTLGTVVATPLLTENFDGVTAPALPVGWTTEQTGATPPALFATTATNPNSAPNAVFTNGSTSVSTNSLISPVINIPSAGLKQLTFTHTLSFESNTSRFDGAVLEISLDGGTTYVDITDPSIGGSFVTNGYNGTISSSFGNPLAGRQSWGGTQTGYVTVTITLPSGFGGSNIKLRWRAGFDSSASGTNPNWRIDNISLVQNTTVCSTCPEIDITGNGNSIADGDATPSLTDHTEFGTVNTGSNLVRTYTVNNTGTAPLTISSIGKSGADMGLFTIGALTPAGAIAPAGSATFTVTFASTTAGPKTATITVNSNDADEAAYDFAVQGTGFVEETGCGPVTTRIYVDASAAPGGTGASWTCALQELSSAITMANGNMAIKSIWVADGTYKPTTSGDRTITMTTLRADLRILGGFSGNETMASQADPAANPTIISGDIGTPNDMSDNSYRLLNIGGRAANANGLVIDGFIFEKANADAPGDGDLSVGPAIHSYLVSTATPVNINRTIFRNNNGRATGAIFLHATNVTFDNCRFVGNTTNGSGGGVLSYQCSPVFNNCVFVNNTAANYGAGYYGNYGNPKFTKTVFTGNVAGVCGGGIYQNRINSDIINCIFNANTSTSGGGGLFLHNASNSNVLNSTFYKNTAQTSGGAIVLAESNSAVVATNNIFYKNMANGNATGSGSDIANLTGGANVWANNILQLNTSVPADNGTTRRFNKRGADPLFTNEISPVGADMMWGTADDGLQLQNCAAPNVANASVAIVPTGCSPAINAGDNAPVMAASLITDERNNPRIVCSIVDMGAYENQNCGVATGAEQEVMIAAQIMSSPKGATGIVANPISNDLQIRYAGTERASVVVFAESGKMIWSKNNIAEGITHADASNWARGMYQVVIVTNNGKRLNFKVVKM